MAHIHSVTDSDKRFTIDESLNITNDGEVKALRREDHAAERYGFKMPRFIEGHDMSLCNVVEVHFDNIHYDSATREYTTNSSFDVVDEFAVAADDENTITFSWLIKGDATQLDGTLNFNIKFTCINNEGIVEYRRFTETFKGVLVGESIHNSEQIEKNHPDVIAAIDARLAELEKSSTGGSTAKIAYITLLANAWQGENELYSQEVTVDGITANSQVDLTPNAEQLIALRSKDLTFVTKNANGVVTVYAIGQKPQNDYIIQATITEVVI